MKKLFLLLIVLFVSFNLFAQKGISFQGIARDVAGNAITGETVTVIFEIGDFTETQNLTTDDFGVFSATIGSVNTTDFNNLVFANMDEDLTVVVDGTTIYDDKFNTVPYAKAAENGVPPGAIMPFAGAADNLPAGWLLCNGDSKAKTGMYSKLFFAIGTIWGEDGGNFNIPDLRGVFLRGINNGRTDDYADPDDTRTVGDFQGDEFESHAHPIIDPGHHHSYSDKYTDKELSDNANDRWVGSNTEFLSDIKNTSRKLTGIIINNTGGDETRPVNAGVNFIIKY